MRVMTIGLDASIAPRVGKLRVIGRLIEIPGDPLNVTHQGFDTADCQAQRGVREGADARPHV